MDDRLRLPLERKEPTVYGIYYAKSPVFIYSEEFAAVGVTIICGVNTLLVLLVVAILLTTEIPLVF
jgi:hypothetical protein